MKKLFKKVFVIAGSIALVYLLLTIMLALFGVFMVNFEHIIFK